MESTNLFEVWTDLLRQGDEIAPLCLHHVEPALADLGMAEAQIHGESGYAGALVVQQVLDLAESVLVAGVSPEDARHALQHLVFLVMACGFRVGLAEAAQFVESITTDLRNVDGN